MTPVKMLQIGTGLSATNNTVSLMRRLVLAGRQSPLIRQFTARLVNHHAQKDYLSEIKTVHAFVRDQIRYVRDINGVETLHHPDFILQNKYGDCDDKTILTCAMLESIGCKTRITVLDTSGFGYCHVIPEVFYGGRWIPLEVTEPVNIGWLPPVVKSFSVEVN